VSNLRQQTERDAHASIDVQYIFTDVLDIKPMQAKVIGKGLARDARSLSRGVGFLAHKCRKTSRSSLRGTRREQPQKAVELAARGVAIQRLSGRQRRRRWILAMTSLVVSSACIFGLKKSPRNDQ